MTQMRNASNDPDADVSGGMAMAVLASETMVQELALTYCPMVRIDGHRGAPVLLETTMPDAEHWKKRAA